jgi:hypothetical protein
MSTIDQSIKPFAAPPTRTQSQSWQIREVQGAIREADNNDFATDDQVDAFFAKYGA